MKQKINFMSDKNFLIFEERDDGTVEIVDIAVGTERRQGLGTEMVKRLFGMVRGKRVWAITRTTNEVAQQFYEKLGFSVAGVLRRYYAEDNGADAVMFVRSADAPY